MLVNVVVGVNRTYVTASFKVVKVVHNEYLIYLYYTSFVLRQ